MNATPDLPEYPWDDMKEQGGPKYKEQFIQMAYEKFPQFEVDHKQALIDYENHKIVKQRFNGELVSKWTGLTNKLLGEFMQVLKKSKEDFSKFVLNSTDEEVKQYVMNVFESRR